MKIVNIFRNAKNYCIVTRKTNKQINTSKQNHERTGTFFKCIFSSQYYWRDQFNFSFATFKERCLTLDFFKQRKGKWRKYLSCFESLYISFDLPPVALTFTCFDYSELVFLVVILCLVTSIISFSPRAGWNTRDIREF